jgi:uncharacterized protein (TIGR02118 family)
MTKLIFLCRRRPDITHQHYVELLLKGHVPIALAHHPTLRKYVINIVEQTRLGQLHLDSIGELWFDSLEDSRERLYDSSIGKEIVERDLRAFLGGADAYATAEHIHKAAAAMVTFGVRSSGVKLICPIQRREGMSHAEFVEHWVQRHVPLALAHHPAMTKYVTNVVDQRLSDSGEHWDGIAELHFAGERDLRERMYDSAAGEGIIRQDIARFIGKRAAYQVGEYVEK